MTADDLALIADFLYGRLYFHSILPPFFCRLSSFGRDAQSSALCTPRNPTFGRVVNRNLDSDLVTGQYSDIVHPEFAGNMRCNDHIIRQLHLECSVWKCFYYYTLKFDHIIFRQISPSLIAFFGIPVENAPS